MRFVVDDLKTGTKLPQILRAALRLFVEKGIDATTTKDIAKRAGVSEGALYRHFPGKDELAWHLFSTNLQDFTAHLKATVAPEPDSERRIKAFVGACFRAFEEDQNLFSFLILSEHRELKRFTQKAEHPGHLVLKIIRDGQRDGSIKKGDPYILGSLFLGAIIRTCVVRMYGGITKNLKTCEQEVAAHLWGMLER